MINIRNKWSKFWNQLGGLIVLFNVIFSISLGFYNANYLWMLALAPSYLIGFYLYRYRFVKSVYNESKSNPFFTDLHILFLASIITVLVAYIVGYCINLIIS